MLPHNQNPLTSAYLGVLVQDGAARVAVSRTGSRYLVQRLRRNSFWVQTTHALDRDTLLMRLPAGFPLEPVQALPQLPQEVVRPWADPLAEAEAEAMKAEDKAENHPALLCVDHKTGVRVIAPLVEGDNFRIQKRTKVRGWSEVAHAPTLRQLSGRVVKKTEPRGHGPRPVRSDPVAFALQAMTALEALCAPLQPRQNPSPAPAPKKTG